MKYSKYYSYGISLVRETIKSKGAACLTDVDLLQAIVGAGGDADESLRIAKALSSVIASVGVDSLTFDDFLGIEGIGDAKASALHASLEFWRRKLVKDPSPLVDSPEAAAEQLEFIRDRKQEHFVLLTLDGARRLIEKRVITIGTLTSSLVHPREVFAPAIEDRAASVIVGHNHPSGYLIISEQDREVSRLLKQAGEMLGIRLDDHIVVARDGFASAM